jgi:hypothetical protein
MSDWGYPGLALPKDAVDPCDGCHECGLRCTAGIHMTHPEFARIADHLRSIGPHDALRVIEQSKQVQWFEDAFHEACLFYDLTRRRCLIYPVRPLICRLFGRVEWLPCPIGKPLPMLHRGLEIIQTYASEKRATFAEWCMADGIFDLRRWLLGQT